MDARELIEQWRQEGRVFDSPEYVDLGSQPGPVDHTVDLGDGYLADYDTDGNLLGIEVL